MEDLPEPLVPPEVDLRDYDYIPLYGDRLFNSDTWSLCDADEKVAALRLWWRAWHEEPAGSLPDNDRLLADRAGYGVAVKAFLAVKKNAMRGWIRCSDDRLYHPVVASIAIDVWRTKHRKRAENQADRERKQRKRRGMSGGQTADVRRASDGIPPENALKRREEKGYSDPYGSAPPSGAHPPPDPVKELWARGLAIIGDTPHGRSLLGKMRKQCGDVAVLGSIVQCEADLPSEPMSYFVQCCEQRKPNGRSASPVTKLYEGAARAVEAILERDSRAGEPVAEPLLDGRRSSRDAASADRRLA